MIKRLIIYLTLLGTVAFWMSCSSPASPREPTALAPDRALSSTLQPTPTIATVVDNCTSCHRDKAALEKLAVKKVEKSEETQGEG